MANMLSRAIQRHHAALARVGGVDAVILFAGEDLALRIIALRSDDATTDVEGEPFTSATADWGVAADELVFTNAGKVEPQEGMEIQVDGKRWKVAPTGGGRCFDGMDSLGILYRVHTVCRGDAVE